ncbi:MAG TPA: RNA methyltransferase, partial [Vicinamibacterales bacterium]|nr:RNA methyltransferase [Vicinamibacterales bacterium]
LSDAELLQSRGLFVAEGRIVVRRVIEDPRYRVRSLLINDAALREMAPVIDRLDAAVPVYVCRTVRFLAITGFNIHRGCLALVERPARQSVGGVLGGAARVAVLEGVTNPDNVGGVFRNAAAFGTGAVILSPTCCDPLYRKAIRTSMGAVLRVPFARADAWPGAVTEIRDAGYTIVALTPREPSMPIAEWRTSQGGPAGQAKIALVVGTEATGLSAEAESIADVRIRIPTTDAVDSLNLAVAVGIALFALRGV